MSNLPLISVVIPVFNGSNYVDEAIESVLLQGYPNIEIVVVNDCSEDEGATASILDGYKNRIKTFTLEQNSGVSGALNCGILQAKGDYVTWLSHDDKMTQDRLSTLVPIAIANPGKIIYSDFALIDESNQIIAGNSNVGTNNTYFTLQPTNILEHLITGRLHGCTLLIPRNKITHNFDLNLRFTQDYQMWLTLMKGTDFLFIDKPLIHSRTHGSNDSLKEGFVSEGNDLWIRNLPTLLKTFDRKVSNYLQFYIYLSNSPFSKALESYTPFIIDFLKSENVNFNPEAHLHNLRAGLPLIIQDSSEKVSLNVTPYKVTYLFLLFIKVRQNFNAFSRSQIMNLVSIPPIGRFAKIILFLILFSKGLSKRLFWKIFKFMLRKLDLMLLTPELELNFSIKVKRNSVGDLPSVLRLLKLLLVTNESTIIYYRDNALIINATNNEDKFKSILNVFKVLQTGPYKGRLLFE